MALFTKMPPNPGALSITGRLFQGSSVLTPHGEIDLKLIHSVGVVKIAFPQF